MSKKKLEINTESASRLKSLLSEHKMTQKDLAGKLGYTEQHMSLLVKGERRLTEEAARNIVKLFPEVCYEWLMGIDDFRTREEKFSYELDQAFKSGEMAQGLLEHLLSKRNLTIQFLKADTQIDGVTLGNDCYAIIENDLVIACLGVHEVSGLMSEWLHYIQYLLDNTISSAQKRIPVPFKLQKEVSKNG